MLVMRTMSSSSLFFLVFCLLTTALYLLSHYSTSLPPPFPLPGPVGKPRAMAFDQLPYKEIKVEDEGTEGSLHEEANMKLEYTSINDNLSGPVYHTDYHGVTTHPAPNPRHPNP